MLRKNHFGLSYINLICIFYSYVQIQRFIISNIHIKVVKDSFSFIKIQSYLFHVHPVHAYFTFKKHIHVYKLQTCTSRRDPLSHEPTQVIFSNHSWCHCICVLYFAVKSACLIAGFETNQTVTHENKDYEISLIGAGDPDQCSVEMDYLFRPDYDCFTKPCSFAGIYQPPFDKTRRFYGTSVSLMNVIMSRGEFDRCQWNCFVCFMVLF